MSLLHGEVISDSIHFRLAESFYVFQFLDGAEAFFSIPVGDNFPGEGFPDTGDEAKIFDGNPIEVERDGKDKQFLRFHPSQRHAYFGIGSFQRGLSCNRDQGSCFQALRQGTVALQRRFFETSCLFKDGSQRWSLAKELNSGSLHLSRDFDDNVAVDLLSGRGEGGMIKPEIKKAEHEKRQESKDPLLTEREALHLGRSLFICFFFFFEELVVNGVDKGLPACLDDVLRDPDRSPP